MNEDSLIETIRTASRTIVRELGFMRTTLAGTEFSPSAVHALLEIERQEMMTAAQLVLVLGLDKSSVSRMVGKLMRAGLLIETAGEDDTRLKPLCLSATGRQTVAGSTPMGGNRLRRHWRICTHCSNKPLLRD